MEAANCLLKCVTWKIHVTLSSQSPWIFNWILYLRLKSSHDSFIIMRYLLPVPSSKRERGVTIDPVCPSCHVDIESTDHIFLECLQR